MHRFRSARRCGSPYLGSALRCVRWGHLCRDGGATPGSPPPSWTSGALITSLLASELETASGCLARCGAPRRGPACPPRTSQELQARAPETASDLTDADAQQAAQREWVELTIGMRGAHSRVEERGVARRASVYLLRDGMVIGSWKEEQTHLSAPLSSLLALSSPLPCNPMLEIACPLPSVMHTPQRPLPTGRLCARGAIVSLLAATGRLLEHSFPMKQIIAKTIDHGRM